MGYTLQQTNKLWKLTCLWVIYVLNMVNVHSYVAMLVYQRRMGSNRYIMGYIMGYVFSQWERNLLVNIFWGGRGAGRQIQMVF